MARKESVLTQDERESFEIDHFIFHIIKNDLAEPIYLVDVELDTDQKTFFKKRFEDVSQGVQHVFINKETSDFYNNCREILRDPVSQFISRSKILAATFQATHHGNTLDGAFIVAVVRVEGNRQLIFLLKIDHKKVFSYEIENDKATLNEIINAFVEDKKAIQKSALIDISDYYAWDVLASDRSGTADKTLTDYFSGFLSVQEKESASNLTTKVIRSIREWAIANKEELNLQEDIAHYKQKGIEYLRAAPQFDAEECIQSIFRDEPLSATVKTNIGNNLKDFFDRQGLSGQAFVPSQGSITASVRRNVRRTAEGVKIEWVGDLNENNIIIPSNKEQDGFFHIVIKTRQIDVLDRN